MLLSKESNVGRMIKLIFVFYLPILLFDKLGHVWTRIACIPSLNTCTCPCLAGMRLSGWRQIWPATHLTFAGLPPLVGRYARYLSRVAKWPCCACLPALTRAIPVVPSNLGSFGRQHFYAIACPPGQVGRSDIINPALLPNLALPCLTLPYSILY